MGLRILHSADWHLDASFSSLPEENRQLLRRAQQRLPELVGALCREHRCDLVLLAGDIFDGIPGTQTVERLKRELSRWGVPVCIAPGNHDYLGPDSPWQEQWPENVHIFKRELSYAVSYTHLTLPTKA